MSIAQIIAKTKEANNLRLNSLAMTGPEKRAADKAVERGLMTFFYASFPGFGYVKQYQLAI